MSETIKIWCDGSYRQRHGTLGAAWIQAAKDGDRDAVERAVTLPRLQHDHGHGSDIAELRAFAGALEGLPAGSHVTVHMDCRNVIDWLNAGRVGNGKKGAHEVAQAFSAALAAKARMATVVICYASDKYSPNMGRAHILSRTASTPGKKDTFASNGHAHQNSRRPARPTHP